MVYEGELDSNGKPSGYGTGTYFDGSNIGVIYSGMWDQGVEHGYGQRSYSNSPSLVIYGEFRFGQIFGKHTVKN